MFILESNDIDQAFAMLPETGGVIRLGPGVYRRTSPLPAPSMPFVLEGAGPETTIIEFELPEPGACVTLAGRSGALKNLGLRGIANAQYGIKILGAYHHLENLCIEGVETGIRGETGNSQNVFEQVRVQAPSLYGFHMYGCANAYHACIVNSGPGTGFRSQETGAIYTGCIADHCDNGFEIAQYAMGVTINGLYAESCQRGLLISANEPAPQTVTINGGFVFRSQSPDGGVVIYRSRHVTLAGILVKESVSGVSFRFSSTAEECRLINCAATDVQPYLIEAGAEVEID